MALLTNYKKTDVKMERVNRIKSLFDYKEFTNEEATELMELEERAIYTGTLLSENLKELGDIFTKAQNIFSNNKNGSFGRWYETIGFKKDFVYLCLDRKNLAIKYDKKNIYSLPERAVKDIKKLDRQNEVKIIYEILESEKPNEKLREIKEVTKQRNSEIVENISTYIPYAKEIIAKKEIMDKIDIIEKLIMKNDINKKTDKIINYLEKIQEILQN